MKQWKSEDRALVSEMIARKDTVFTMQIKLKGKYSRTAIKTQIHELYGSPLYRKLAPWHPSEDLYLNNSKHSIQTYQNTLGRSKGEIVQRLKFLETSAKTDVVPVLKPEPVVPKKVAVIPQKPITPYWIVTSTMINRGREKPRFWQRLFMRLAGIEWRGYPA